MSQLPHFVRVARAIALFSGVASAGCASMVVPYDPDASYADGNVPADGPQTTDRPDTGLLANGCPRSRPYPYGAPCDQEGLVCDPDPCSGLVCRSRPPSNARTWGPNNVCNGPLPPPEDLLPV